MTYKYRPKERMEPAYCLECGDQIIYGRTDRKFCCPECKNRYHNKKSWDWRGYRLKVLNNLERNHDILQRLLELGVSSIDKNDLARMGYNFEYQTGSRRIRAGHSGIQLKCFDIVFTETDTRFTNIYRLRTLAEYEKSAPPSDGEAESGGGAATLSSRPVSGDP